MNHGELKNYVARSTKTSVKKETLTVALPIEVKQKLWDVADRFQCDLSIIVRAAIDDFLKEQERREPPLPFEEQHVN